MDSRFRGNDGFSRNSAINLFLWQLCEGGNRGGGIIFWGVSFVWGAFWGLRPLTPCGPIMGAGLNRMRGVGVGRSSWNDVIGP
mgnify:CR=1 FL=1